MKLKERKLISEFLELILIFVQPADHNMKLTQIHGAVCPESLNQLQAEVVRITSPCCHQNIGNPVSAIGLQICKLRPEWRVGSSQQSACRVLISSLIGC